MTMSVRLGEVWELFKFPEIFIHKIQLAIVSELFSTFNAQKFIIVLMCPLIATYPPHAIFPEAEKSLVLY